MLDIELFDTTSVLLLLGGYLLVFAVTVVAVYTVARRKGRLSRLAAGALAFLLPLVATILLFVAM